jgi:hypothetical protein
MDRAVTRKEDRNKDEIPLLQKIRASLSGLLKWIAKGKEGQILCKN